MLDTLPVKIASFQVIIWCYKKINMELILLEVIMQQTWIQKEVQVLFCTLFH